MVLRGCLSICRVSTHRLRSECNSYYIMALRYASRLLIVICSQTQSPALRIKCCNQWGAFLLNDGLVGFIHTIQAGWMDTSTQCKRVQGVNQKSRMLCFLNQRK